MSIWSDLANQEFSLHYVDANGVRTRVLEAGKGTPLILLHGTGGHIEAYARNIPELSKHFRVICIDMLGHGYTDKPEYPYGIDAYSDHLLSCNPSVETRSCLLIRRISWWLGCCMVLC